MGGGKVRDAAGVTGQKGEGRIRTGPHHRHDDGGEDDDDDEDEDDDDEEDSDDDDDDDDDNGRAIFNMGGIVPHLATAVSQAP